MPAFRVEFRPAAVRALEALPQNLRARLAAKAAALSTDPFPPGVKKLAGTGLHRIRSGDYRIIYQVEGDVLVVLVVRIGTRGEVQE